MELGSQVGMLRPFGVTGPEFRVSVDCITKRFVTLVDEKQMGSDTWDGLDKAVRLFLRKRKVQHAIPVVLCIANHRGGDHYVRAVLRGQHLKTQHYLFTMDGHEKFSDHHPHVIFRGDKITDVELAELNRLDRESRLARQKVDKFISDRTTSQGSVSAWALLEESALAALKKEDKQ